ncbi:hypothetical protein [Caballeronia sordidicola]|uniref:hypothetical protein n=1 Tax=Caballeronia sordidicola TaxID=196367 RepID=UPI000AB5F505|nr:hypothetical protein [Caballeronia sordidicola]
MPTANLFGTPGQPRRPLYISKKVRQNDLFKHAGYVAGIPVICSSRDCPPRSYSEADFLKAILPLAQKRASKKGQATVP